MILLKSTKGSISHNFRVTTPTRVDESDGMRRRVRAAAIFFFFVAQAINGKLSLSASLAWSEECHPRNSDGGAAIDVLSVSFWGVDPSILMLFGRWC